MPSPLPASRSYAGLFLSPGFGTAHAHAAFPALLVFLWVERTEISVSEMRWPHIELDLKPPHPKSPCAVKRSVLCFTHSLLHSQRDGKNLIGNWFKMEQLRNVSVAVTSNSCISKYCWVCFFFLFFLNSVITAEIPLPWIEFTKEEILISTVASF